MKVRMFVSLIDQNCSKLEEMRQEMQTYLTDNEDQVIKTVELVIPTVGSGVLPTLLVIVYLADIKA